MKIKVVTPDLRFPIRIWVPYAAVNILTSRLVYKWILRTFKDKDAEIIRQIDPKMLKGVMECLKQFKGTELVTIKEKNGTIVKITL
ncbi:hypothetical protein ACOI1C_10525 [Bacillus sp. DJP31]|uniref:hypothetical protein n=1 Tax=Bacillus sp. DJP31 TaxID=3409789 RepID=UPI003BB51009